MIIVLETRGKNEDVDYVKIKLFTSTEEAQKYCVKNTDNPMNKKHWKLSEIIEEGMEYEIYRYENI